MRKEKVSKFLREGDYLVEVEVTRLIDDDPLGWGSCLSPQDAQKLDDAREALRNRDFAAANRLAKVYKMKPVVFDE